MTARISQTSLTRTNQSNLQRALSRTSALQNQLSSGKVINKPSDAPAGTASALQYRSSIRRADQLQRNASDGLGWLQEADTALASTVEVVNRARDLALSGINGAMGPTDRAALAQEVDGLRSQALALANTSRLGRPIFAGTAAPAPGQPDVAYDVTGAFKGDAGKVERAVAPGVSMQVNVSGPEAFGPAGNSLFDVLARISDHLRNDPTQLRADVNGLDTVMTGLQKAQATVGARTNQLDALMARVAQVQDGQRSALSTIEDIDLPKTISDLQVQNLAYQAALSATAKSVQPSLMDFLR